MVLRKYSNNFQEFKLVSGPKNGPSKNFFALLKLSTKEYVAFADFYKQVLETPEDQLPQAFIAKLNNELVATISLTEEEGEVLQPWVSNLYVDPTHRKNGIGGFLMEMIIDVAKVRGFKEVYGWTNSKQEEFYYRKRGWEVIETRENDVVIIKKSTL